MPITYGYDSTQPEKNILKEKNSVKKWIHTNKPEDCLHLNYNTIGLFIGSVE